MWNERRIVTHRHDGADPGRDDAEGEHEGEHSDRYLDQAGHTFIKKESRNSLALRTKSI